MRAVVQRVSRAKVTVDSQITGQIETGLLVLVAAHKEDTEQDARWLADRIKGLRIFNDSEGKMNLALDQVNGQVLAVSQFTLYGDANKSRRPSFTQSAPYEEGKRLYEAFLAELRTLGISVEAGVFGVHMEVELTNDGPVTLILDSK